MYNNILKIVSVFAILLCFSCDGNDKPYSVVKKKVDPQEENSGKVTNDSDKKKPYPVPAHERITQSSMPEFLRTPAEKYVEKMKVLVLAYLPVVNGDKSKFDKQITGIDIEMNQIKEKIIKMSVQSKHMLEEGSKFRGYKNPEARPYLGYEIVDFYWVYDSLPRGRYAGYDTYLKADNYFPNYDEIVKTWKGKYYVDTVGVDEIWLWGWHYKGIVPKESNMSSPHRDKYTTTGNVSNSDRLEDMPVYDNTYILYNYNYARSANQAVHNHGHQIENMLWHVSYLTTEDEVFIRNNFSGWVWDDPVKRKDGPLGAVGDCHHPVNTRKDYDYNNKTMVESDIEDWNPNRTGQKKFINCKTWYNYFGENWPEGFELTEPTIGTPSETLTKEAKTEAAWYIYWMQSIPGYDHNIYYDNGTEKKKLTNWMKMIADWDKFLSEEMYLWEEF